MKWFWLLLLTLGVAWADPCGMVPPIQLPDTDGPAIERVGLQRTYVFYKDGVETVVIHPGFRGRVDQFGMLIPFPSPPALRKMPDDIFTQIEQAAHPPVIHYGNWPRTESAPDDGLALAAPARQAGEEVRVLREEAVGMYEVAVLEAGSAAALKRWMEDKGYRYPRGMDATCEEYVAEGWCFVAVKTRVGRKAGVEPRPGMRKVEPRKPAESEFSGHVQAMGFRFTSGQLVVPMRLSAFNEGPLDNKLYLLAPEPMRIKNLDAAFVQEQIDGQRLYRNLTELLPYQLQGMDEQDLNASMKLDLDRMRDPKPKNGKASELFASDLLAVGGGQLSLGFEETEKQLLDIGERLNLRAGRLDLLHHRALQERKEKALAQALEGVKEMTLTILGGDFPRQTLARENLVFSPYKLEQK